MQEDEGWAHTIEQRLRQLEDKEQIRQAVYSYAHGTDRCDRELIRAAYHHDAWDDHGSFRGDRDTVTEIIASNKGGALNSQHHVGNILIELEGDLANVESYFVACQLREIESTTYTRLRAGRYLDQFERRQGRWRILRRRVVEDWARLDEVVQVPPEVATGCTWGTRDRDDLSYELSDFTGVFDASDSVDR